MISSLFNLSSQIVVLKHSNAISSLPSDIQSKLLLIAEKVFENRPEALNQKLLANFTVVSELSALDLKKWKITGSFFDQLSRNLISLSLSASSLEKKDMPQLLSFLNHHPQINSLDLEGLALPDEFFYIPLKNLRVLKLKKCSGDFTKLQKLLENNPSIEHLDLPPMNLNKDTFGDLIQKIGKNLTSLSVEHQEKFKRRERHIFGKKIVDKVLENGNKVAILTHLMAIGFNCPNLTSIHLTNIDFHSSLWLSTRGSKRDNYATLWKSILFPLSHLKKIKFENEFPEMYTDALAFLEDAYLPKYEKMTLKKFFITKKIRESLKNTNPQLHLIEKNCTELEPASPTEKIDEILMSLKEGKPTSLFYHNL